MIEVELARNGKPILKKDGRLLASSVDPIREATAWADRICQTTAPHDMIVVIGLGSGYHVVELLARRPQSQIIVVESDEDVHREALKICPQLSNTIIVVQPEWIKLIEERAIRDAIGGVYRIAIHGPTSQIDGSYVQSVDSLLRGRDKLSFLLLLKTRPELIGILDPDAIAQIGDAAISIKTVSSLFGSKALASRERRLWRVLEELVQ